MPEAECYDLIIVGLGPVGAVAANLAGAAGLRTLVIERDTVPYNMPRAIVFDAEIMRVFASIGLAEEIAAVTKPLGGSVYIGSDGEPIRRFQTRERAHPLDWYPSNLFYQPQLETILRAGIARFDNVTVELGCAFVDHVADGRGVAVRHARGKAHGAFLLACDGASSPVRKALGTALDDIGFEERWLVVDAEVDGPMDWPDDYHIPEEVRDGRFSLMVCDPRRPATLIPGRGNHRRWEFMLLDGEDDDVVTGQDWLRGEIGRWVDPTHVKILRATVYRFRALVAQDWRSGTVFLGGDAAHQTPPFFGQGMCHGIRDAAQLMWRLSLARDGVAGEALLDTYQTEREPHVRAIIAASVAAGAEVCKLDPQAALERDAAFRAAEAKRRGTVAISDIVPPITAGVVDQETGGERLPQFAVPTAWGGQRLDELLANRFTLIQSSDTAADLQDPRWLSIRGQTLSGIVTIGDRLAHWLSDAGADWAIIRPDRYVYAKGRGKFALVDAVDRLLSIVASEAVPDHLAQYKELTIS